MTDPEEQIPEQEARNWFPSHLGKVGVWWHAKVVSVDEATGELEVHFSSDDSTARVLLLCNHIHWFASSLSNKGLYPTPPRAWNQVIALPPIASASKGPGQHPSSGAKVAAAAAAAGGGSKKGKEEEDEEDEDMPLIKKRSDGAGPSSAVVGKGEKRKAELVMSGKAKESKAPPGASLEPTKRIEKASQLPPPPKPKIVIASSSSSSSSSSSEGDDDDDDKPIVKKRKKDKVPCPPLRPPALSLNVGGADNIAASSSPSKRIVAKTAMHPTVSSPNALVGSLVTGASSRSRLGGGPGGKGGAGEMKKKQSKVSSCFVYSDEDEDERPKKKTNAPAPAPAPAPARTAAATDKPSIKPPKPAAPAPPPSGPLPPPQPKLLLKKPSMPLDPFAMAGVTGASSLARLQPLPPSLELAESLDELMEEEDVPHTTMTFSILPSNPHPQPHPQPLVNRQSANPNPATAKPAPATALDPRPALHLRPTAKVQDVSKGGVKDEVACTGSSREQVAGSSRVSLHSVRSQGGVVGGGGGLFASSSLPHAQPPPFATHEPGPAFSSGPAFSTKNDSRPVCSNYRKGLGRCLFGGPGYNDCKHGSHPISLYPHVQEEEREKVREMERRQREVEEREVEEKERLEREREEKERWTGVHKPSVPVSSCPSSASMQSPSPFQTLFYHFTLMPVSHLAFSFCSVSVRRAPLCHQRPHQEEAPAAEARRGDETEAAAATTDTWSWNPNLLSGRIKRPQCFSISL